MTAASQPPSDPAAVHRGLLAIARERKADFNAILAQYAIERLIDRLSKSAESPRFVLKGAMLFRVWTSELHRPTRDVDFLGRGDPSPAVVSEEFGCDDEKRLQWNAYLTRMSIDDMPTSLPEVIMKTQTFVLPAVNAAAGTGPTPGHWNPASGWR